MKHLLKILPEYFEEVVKGSFGIEKSFVVMGLQNGFS